MAREFGAFYYSAWNDMDFRTLPDPAQALYFKLVVHPSLSWAGVGDWRPGRIATMSQGLDADGVRHVAACLIARRYIVVDDDTEEFLIRTYLKHDRIMRHAKLSVSMAKAFGDIGSNDIRMVLSDELHKLREAEPELCGWTKPAVLGCLETPRLSAFDREVPGDPFSNGFRYEFRSGFSNVVSLRQTKTDPGVKESVKECPTPAPTPAPLAPTPSASADIEDEFADWYDAYPRKEARGRALRAYKTARKKVSADVLLSTMVDQIPTLTAKGREFVPHPASWLNGERWADEHQGALTDSAPNVGSQFVGEPPEDLLRQHGIIP